jgi:flagellar motility protein MotE (MotC chaperone)
MEIEDRLMELKRKIEKTQSEIQRNEGRLGGLYDELRSLLGEPAKTTTKVLVAKANKEITKLKKDIKNQETEIEKLMEEIENEMEEWDEKDE